MRLKTGVFGVALAATLLPSGVHAQKAAVEADHIFIYSSPGAKAEADELRKLGFVVDTTVTRHTGQGTASRSVILENGYIELIWIDSAVSVAAEARALLESMRPAAAWRTSGASPFGLGLRPRDNSTDYGVPAKSYSAPWMKAGSSIALLKQDSEPDALEIFVVPDYMALPSWIGQLKEHMPSLLAHPNGAKRITRIEVHGPASHHPVAARSLVIPGFTMREAAEPVAIIELDGGTRGIRSDLRPVLPLVLLR